MRELPPGESEAHLRRRRLVPRGEELDDHGHLRVAPAARSPGGAVQGAEHVEQFLPVPRRRRDRAGTGCAGRTGTGVVVGMDAAWVVWVAATVGAAAAAGAGVAARTFGGVAAEATVIGVEVGTLGF